MGCVKMQRHLWYLGLLCLIHVVACNNAEDLDDDLINYNLDRLYEEPADNVDPHDMLAYPGQKRDPSIDIEDGGVFGSERRTRKDVKDTESWNSDDQLMRAQEQLNTCQGLVSKLEHDIQAEQQKSAVLQKKLMNEGFIDMSAFYTRLIHHLWNTLHLEEVEHILKDGNAAMIRHLMVRVTKDDVDGLQQYLQHQTNVHKVDEFFQHAFKLEEPPVEDAFNFIQSFIATTISVVEVGKNVETWLYILSFGFLVLALWAIFLFIQDIQQELKWGRVLCMMAVIVFFICCLWQWRHMHKVAESRRHAQMVKRGFGFDNIPEECKPGNKGTARSVIEWLKITVFGSPDVCERYFEEIMVDPTQEITPAMVIAETLAKFFLQPLQHVGSESAKSITNFYSNVPVLYHVPATILFVVMLVIILFYASGYGIDFPLWMGGIRPVYRSESSNTSEVDKITKEAIAQLKHDRQIFLEESRSMLTDITRAAVATQNQIDVRPLILTSSTIMESELERLISHKLASIIQQKAITDIDSAQPLAGNHETPEHNSNIFTMTSTPVGKSITHKDNMEDEVCLEEITRNQNQQSRAMGVSTDAVHYRMTGTRRKKVLPSRNEMDSRTNPDPYEARHNVSLDRAADRNEEQQFSSNVSVRKKTNTASSLESHANQECTDISQMNSSNESVEFDNNTQKSEEFFSQVKSILEESVNSSLNDSNAFPDTGSAKNIRRRHNKTLNISQEESRKEYLEEVEHGESSTDFLKTVRDVMTPEADLK
ncbi:uncharacterized protein [Procambarus clarkii]|uniref:uncharacterized protein isoform X1 n=2 Tax=Procambarus clarkii TaxID=6728 RepID=UPI0037437551